MLRVALRSIAAAAVASAASAGARGPDRPVVVRIEGFSYVPAKVEVGIGDTVVYRNGDPVPHTVTMAGGPDSGSIPPGESWRWVARHHGSYAFGCRYHPTMRGQILVR